MEGDWPAGMRIRTEWNGEMRVFEVVNHRREQVLVSITPDDGLTLHIDASDTNNPTLIELK